MNKLRLILPPYSQQINWYSQHSNQKAHANDHGFHIKGHQNQERANHEKSDGNNDCHSNRSGHIWLFPTQIQQTGNR